MISNLIDVDGVQYSKVVQRIKKFDIDPIDSIYVGNKHVYAQSKKGLWYFWGYEHSGLALSHSKKVIQEPISLPSLNKFGFSDLVTSHDHTLALGSTVSLSFSMGELGVDLTTALTMQAYHVYSEKRFKDRGEVLKAI